MSWPNGHKNYHNVLIYVFIEAVPPSCHLRTVQVENRATDVFESTTLCHPLRLLFLSKRKISHQNVKFSITSNQSDREKYQMGHRARLGLESICQGNSNFYVQNSWFLRELLSYHVSSLSAMIYHFPIQLGKFIATSPVRCILTQKITLNGLIVFWSDNLINDRTCAEE